MDWVLRLLVVIVCFIAGVLVGRANPKKADKLAEIAKKVEDAAKKVDR